MKCQITNLMQHYNLLKEFQLIVLKIKVQTKRKEIEITEAGGMAFELRHALVD